MQFVRRVAIFLEKLREVQLSELMLVLLLQLHELNSYIFHFVFRSNVEEAKARVILEDWR